MLQSLPWAKPCSAMTNQEKEQLAAWCASQEDLLSVDEWLDEIERVIGDTFEVIDEEEEEGA
jgi:hypothetical protein